MMSLREHVVAIGRLVEARLHEQDPAGVVELVERCRDEHLASLDADDGLAALQVPWSEVAAEVLGRHAG
jgi:hypothetical protein